MANNYSDHKTPYTNINDFLPEVHRSDVSRSVFDTAFNRHLTKDDTARVAGYIGEGNPQALVDRQIKEREPHRQAYQLAPTMYTRVGTEETSLSYKAFLRQLELTGVDIDRMQKWNDPMLFNWVPPVNIDMLVNYQDYFWKPQDPTAPAQYFTVENRCNKAKSKVTSYQNVLQQRGSSFEMNSIKFATNEITILQKYDDLFVEGFVFFTRNVENPNLKNKYWTVDSSSFDAETGITTCKLVETIAVIASTSPAPAFVGQWWFDTSLNLLKEWDGVTWTPAFGAVTATISLTELALVYQTEANCKCNQDLGWDIGSWDDSQLSPVPLWDAALLTTISFVDEGDWTGANGAPSFQDLWYDLSIDALKQWSGTEWKPVGNNFSAILAKLDGNTRWDMTIGCEPQLMNQWSEQNQWIHKSEVTSFAAVKRAQAPILEFNSSIELNEWVKVTHKWKYRAEADAAFASVDFVPVRFELEPIKGFAVTHIGSTWYIYLFDKNQTVTKDIDYTKTFVPGFRFRITDDANRSDTYTVTTAEYRAATMTDPVAVRGNYMVTVIGLEEDAFVSPVDGGGVLNTRIEPLTTSQGDTWRGYHAHWLLDTIASESAPTAPQPWDYFRRTSIESDITPVAVRGNAAYATFEPQVESIYLGVSHQELTVDVADTTTIHLAKSLQYNSGLSYDMNGSSTPFALAGSAELRVYVNGIRQYGSYEELVATGKPHYTVVGNIAYSDSEPSAHAFSYVTGIKFQLPLKLFDVVRIEVGPAAFTDMGMVAVPVRTVEDEVEFTLATVDGVQPQYLSLCEYHHAEQSKTAINQYPQFNVYHAITGEVIKASHLFGFREDAQYSVNGATHRRIAVSSDGREYEFEQTLLDFDNNQLYAYRDNNTSLTYWFSPLQNTLKYWDGKAWTSDVLVDTPTGKAMRRPVVSDVEPVELSGIIHALWFNTATRTLYKRNNATTAWEQITTIVISDSDPALKTVWRRGKNNERAIPQYVDKSKAVVPVGSTDGEWALADQWQYNPEHENRAVVKYSQLITHFNSIIAAQPKIPGLLKGGTYTLSQDGYNYGLGGTIKDHNESYDTLISAINVTNVTPIGVLEFAAQQYMSNVLSLRDLFNQMIKTVFADTSSSAIANFQEYVAAQVIGRFEDNDFQAQVYGDTSAYDAVSKKGVRNWIATAPMFGLSKLYRPHLNIDPNFIQLVHHDGHRSTIGYTTAEHDKYARQLTAMVDPRGGKFGVVSANLPPTTEAAYFAAFGGSSVRPGSLWYRAGAGVHQLYRFAAIEATPLAPSFYDRTGNEIPDGSMYYDTQAHSSFRKEGMSWVQAGTNGTMTAMWVPVNFGELLGRVLLEVEERLYSAVKSNIQVFDYATLTADADDIATYASLYKSRFDAYVSARELHTPLVNVAYNPSNAFSWNYVASVVVDSPRSDITPAPAGAWQEVYTQWYGTPYPHLEPWKLQGYTDKPTWWDSEYRDLTGSRKWKFTYAPNAGSLGVGMWENIRVGNVPAGRPYPDGSISTGNAAADDQSLPQYTYFSVNISGTVIAGSYLADELLPPYYDNSAIAVSLPGVRSLFTSYMDHVVAPDADYAFGDVGPTEWQWKVSGQHVYDSSIIAFMMQPMRFMHAAFGPHHVTVDGLQVEVIFNQVYSHEDALFHGDVYDTDKSYVARGMNQWYVNFNRYTGFDTNGQFREMWAGWEPRLTYQFAGIIDTSSFDIRSKYFDLINQDYNVMLVNNGAFRDIWVDAFEVSLLNIPPPIIQYNNQAAWKMELDSLSAIPRTIEYYGVKAYPFVIDPVTDEATAHRYQVLSAAVISRRFVVSGDQSAVFTPGRALTVSGSGANDGTYTVASSAFDVSSGRTRINVVEPVATNQSGGNIDVANFALPFETGDMVVFSSVKTLPAPLTHNTAYYIVKTGVQSFKIAESMNFAMSGITLDVTSTGEDALTVAQIESSFYIFGGAGNSAELWYHYALDKNDIRTFTPPHTVAGMQTLINMIDGYAEFQKDLGILFGLADSNDFDPMTGRVSDWQLETERFIDWAYGLRQARMTISDRYNFTVDPATSELTFSSTVPVWQNGTAVQVLTSGALPEPLIAGTQYYVVRTENAAVIRLSVSPNPGDTSAYVDITTEGGGAQTIGVFEKHKAYPRFELNAARNNIWIDTPLGVLSNVVQGPYADIRVQQTIFDQYGRAIKPDSLMVYRQDERSRVSIRSGIPNDYDIIYRDDPYNYIHFGGGHFFVEGYEHFLLFNNYTVSGDLIYDPFLGLHSKKFDVDYYEKQEYTLRPTLGGYYLLDKEFLRNMEGSATDAQNMYDTLALSETSDFAKHSRKLVGYTGRSSFLDLLNINSKSQFLFYRGMIQKKGSLSSMNAYVNSRRFVDAQLDEYWAYKIAEYGDARPRVYPEVKLVAADGLGDDLRLEFLASSELPTDPDVIVAKSKGFKIMSFKDPSLWNNFYEQLVDVKTPLFLDAEITTMTAVYSGPTAPPASVAYDIDFWYDGAVLRRKNDAKQWVVIVPKKIAKVSRATKSGGTPTDVIYWKHDVACDDVRVLRRSLTGDDFNNYTTEIFGSGSGVLEYSKVNTEVVRFDAAGFVGVMLIFTVNPAADRISPAKLIDVKANTVVQNLPLWHPAIGHHSPVAIHNVDQQLDTDPARYEVTLNPTHVSASAWNRTEIGRVWLDTSHLGYVPYYDDIVFPNINDRLHSWGKLAPWADIKVYEWVESPVSPDMWDNLVLDQAGDNTILQNKKASGTPRKTVFKRTRISHPVTYDVATSTIFLANNPFVNGSTVTLSSDASLPEGLMPNTRYVVAFATDSSFKVLDEELLEVVPFITVGGGILTVSATFEASGWTKQPLLRHRMAAAFDFGLTEPVQFPVTLPALSTVIFTPSTAGWAVGDVVDVYKNGVIAFYGRPVLDLEDGVLGIQLPADLKLREADTVDLIRPQHMITDEETEFDPDTVDDGTIHVQWKEDFEFTAVTSTLGSLNTRLTTETKYYFWVEGATTRDSENATDISLSEIKTQLLEIPTPHIVVQKPKDDPYLAEKYGYGLTSYGSVYSLGTLSEQFYQIPVLYRQAIIRKAASYINDDNRYILRFTRDFSLREDVTTKAGQANLKNKHEQWFMFRKNQPSSVPLELWTRLTEALVGYKLTNSVERVPSLTRELYDSAYGTETRFGLGPDQAFCDKALGLNTVVKYLQDPTISFAPTDIDDFFARQSFDTPENIKQAMETIYYTFGAEHVNNIWFGTLMDALSTRGKYKELMKTSWIALHGIRVLEVGGLFDD